MAYRVALAAALLSLAFLYEPVSAQESCSALWRLYRYWQSSDSTSYNAALNMVGTLESSFRAGAQAKQGLLHVVLLNGQHHRDEAPCVA